MPGEDTSSYRQVADYLGLSLVAVQRAEKRHKAAAQTVEVDVDDPIVSLLTDADMKCLHMTPYDVSLDTLQRCRFLSLPPDSAAGQAARGLFDHGRGLEVFAVWCWVDDPAGRPGVAPAASEDEPLPLSVRDERIIELTRDGLTQREIAEQLGMTQAAISKALVRLAIDGPRRQARKDDDDETESEGW